MISSTDLTRLQLSDTWSPAAALLAAATAQTQARKH